jgi:hypothetical protein
MPAVRLLPAVLCLVVAATSSGALSQRASPARPIVLAPHRAVYDLTLEKSVGSSPLVAALGRLVYELTGSACQGYTQNMRFVTRSTSNEGETSLTDQRSSTWEDGEGMQFRFASSQYRDQELAESSNGTARRTADMGDIRVALAKPEQKEVIIDGKALFPIQHSIALIAAARKGARLFTADFYDGSETGRKSYLTTAVIGRPMPAGFNKSLPPLTNGDRLDGVAAWPVSLSYFEQAPDTLDTVPAYEMAFVFYDNGVSRRLFIDNGEYSMRGELTELTFLDVGNCAK